MLRGWSGYISRWRGGYTYVIIAGLWFFEPVQIDNTNKNTMSEVITTLPTPPGVPTQTEIQKFQAWYEAEKKNGLKDIKFYTRGIDKTNEENFFAEVNRAIRAETLTDPEFF